MRVSIFQIIPLIFDINEVNAYLSFYYTPKHLAQKILQSKTALEGEPKQVTTLFCDIANSTVLANRLGPEDRAAREVIDGLKAGLQNSELRNSLQNFSPVKRLDRLIEDKSLGVGYR